MKYSGLIKQLSNSKISGVICELLADISTPSRSCVNTKIV